MSSDPEPLDEDVRALLDDVDRMDASSDAAIVVRMRNRIDLALIASAAAEPAVPPVGAPPAAAPVGSPLRRVLSFGGTFAAGAVVALAAQRLLAPAPVTTVSPPPVLAPAVVMDTPSAATVPTSIAPAVSPLAAAAPGIPTPRSTASASAHASGRTLPRPPEEIRDEDLAAESRLVDTARSALAHGDFTAALVAATNHERRFPAGRLTEEREAILIQALAGAHQEAEAKTRGGAFRARYPQSFFLPLVNRALTSAAQESPSPRFP